jgi:hypothetical protein
MLFQLKKIPEIINLTCFCVAVATLANEKLLKRASDNDLLLCRSQLRIKRVIDNDLIDV